MRGLFLCLALSGAAAFAEPQVIEHRLSNGMVWLLVPRPQAPVFSAYLRIKAGGLNEEAGGTGLAHLFEHMAFKGTPVVGTRDFEAEKPLLREIAQVGDRIAELERGADPAQELPALKQRLAALEKSHGALTDENALLTLFQLNGASGLNATTNKDLTSYYVNLPKNRLALWALLEASRFASPVLRDFYRERDVVMEERRMRIDSNPEGALFEELNAVAFTQSPYRWPTVGYIEDLEAMTLRQAHRFHARHYVPANAVGCLVGDFDLTEARVLLDRTFGQLPAATPPAQPSFAEAPRRSARRSTVLYDAKPRWMLAFPKPTLPSNEDTVFDVIEVLLGEGRTGRLYRRLVLEDRLVQGVRVSGAPGARLENLLVVSATPLEGVPVEKVERAVWEELERLKREPVPAAELEKVGARIQADLARAIESNQGMASTLSYAQAVAGSWRYAIEQPARIARVTAQEIQAVAQRYFQRGGSATVELRAPEAARGEAR